MNIRERLGTWPLFIRGGEWVLEDVVGLKKMMNIMSECWFDEPKHSTACRYLKFLRGFSKM